MVEEERGQSLPDILFQEAEIVRLLTESEGEVTRDLEELIKSNQDAFKKKIDSYSYVIEVLSAQAEFRAKRAKKERALKAFCEASIDKIKNRLRALMFTFGKRELEGFEEGFKFTNQFQIELKNDSDISLIPQQFVRTKVVETKELDKDALKNAWEGLSTEQKEELLKYVVLTPTLKPYSIAFRKELPHAKRKLG